MEKSKKTWLVVSIVTTGLWLGAVVFAALASGRGNEFAFCGFLLAAFALGAIMGYAWATFATCNEYITLPIETYREMIESIKRLNNDK